MVRPANLGSIAKQCISIISRGGSEGASMERSDFVGVVGLIAAHYGLEVHPEGYAQRVTVLQKALKVVEHGNHGSAAAAAARTVRNARDPSYGGSKTPRAGSVASGDEMKSAPVVQKQKASGAKPGQAKFQPPSEQQIARFHLTEKGRSLLASKIEARAACPSEGASEEARARMADASTRYRIGLQSFLREGDST